METGFADIFSAPLLNHSKDINVYVMRLNKRNYISKGVNIFSLLVNCLFHLLVTVENKNVLYGCQVSQKRKTLKKAYVFSLAKNQEMSKMST